MNTFHNMRFMLRLKNTNEYNFFLHLPWSISFPANQHGNGRVMHDVITNTAQECPAQFALSSTSGDDERRIDFLGDL